MQERLLYIVSGLVYLHFAFTAIRVEMGKQTSEDQNQHLAGGCGCVPSLVWPLRKIQKHVQGLLLQANNAKLLLRAGKVGYISRGVVWLLVAYLFLRAAFHAAASEAGNTGKAFQSSKRPLTALCC